MRRPYLLLLLLLLLFGAACADPGPEVAERLLARRVALGLSRDRLAFEAAMERMEERRFEALLARVGSKRLARAEVLDAALRIENLLLRADPETAGAARQKAPAEFEAWLRRARERASALARATAGGETGEGEARELLTTCLGRHLSHRERR